MKYYEAIFALMLATTVTFASSWQSSTTLNGQRVPISAGKNRSRVTSLSASTEKGGMRSSTESPTLKGDMRIFNIVISHWDADPEGDNDGNKQDADPANWSKQDKIEKTIQYAADSIYEATEGRHSLGTVKIYKGWKNKEQCDIQWKQDEPEFKTFYTINRENGYRKKWRL